MPLVLLPFPGFRFSPPREVGRRGISQKSMNFAFDGRAVIMGGTMESDNSWLDSRPPRLGDLIDDYCPRCKRLMNHAIASFVGEKVVKVICQTCYSEHPYFEGKERKKTPKSASTAFDQVLAKKAPRAVSPPPTTPRKSKSRAGSRRRKRRQAKAPSKDKDQ